MGRSDGEAAAAASAYLDGVVVGLGHIDGVGLDGRRRVRRGSARRRELLEPVEGLLPERRSVGPSK